MNIELKNNLINEISSSVSTQVFEYLRKLKLDDEDIAHVAISSAELCICNFLTTFIKESDLDSVLDEMPDRCRMFMSYCDVSKRKVDKENWIKMEENDN